MKYQFYQKAKDYVCEIYRRETFKKIEREINNLEKKIKENAKLKTEN